VNFSKQLSENKFLEIEFNKWESPDSYFSVVCSWTTKGDHNGFTFDVDIWRWSFSFKIYDTRHWDWEQNCYEVYDDPETDALDYSECNACYKVEPQFRAKDKDVL